MSADPGDRHQRRHLARLRQSGHDRIGAAAVLAREQPAPAEQIETIVRSARRPAPAPGSRTSGASARRQPSWSRRNTPLAAAHTASSPSGEKASANTAPMMTSRASGTQLRPPLCELRIPRSVPTSRWDEFAWIDRNDERRIEKQADIRIQPGGAEIAGAKHAAIAARIMRRRAAGQERQHAGKPEGQPTHADFGALFNPRMKRSGWGDWSHPEKHPLMACAIFHPAPARSRPCVRRSAPPRNSSSADICPCSSAARGRRRSCCSRR